MQQPAYGCHQMVAQTRASEKFGICCSSQCDKTGLAFFGECTVSSCWGAEVPYVTFSALFACLQMCWIRNQKFSSSGV